MLITLLKWNLFISLWGPQSRLHLLLCSLSSPSHSWASTAVNAFSYPLLHFVLHFVVSAVCMSDCRSLGLAKSKFLLRCCGWWKSGIIYTEHYSEDITMNDARLIEAETGLGLWDGVHRIAICYYYADDGFYSTPSSQHHRHHHHHHHH